jgi:hypothetical protein
MAANVAKLPYVFATRPPPETASHSREVPLAPRPRDEQILSQIACIAGRSKFAATSTPIDAATGASR